MLRRKDADHLNPGDRVYEHATRAPLMFLGVEPGAELVEVYDQARCVHEYLPRYDLDLVVSES